MINQRVVIRTAMACLFGLTGCASDFEPEIDRSQARLNGPSMRGEIAAGAHHHCSIGSNRKIYCVGQNALGQLGDGTEIDRTLASTPVQGLANQVYVAAGWMHSCGVGADGSIKCWGLNGWGQLGIGATSYRSLAPVPVVVGGGAPLTGVVEVGAGLYHTCARTQTGQVYCWGKNHDGQLGDGTQIVRAWAAPVSLPLPATELAVGDHHTCAKLLDKTVRCWGANSSGELGDGTTVRRLTPVAVSGLSNVAGISATYNGSCAFLTDGTMKCWGQGAFAQLGTGTTANQLTPAFVRNSTNTGNLTGVYAIASGGRFHNCAATGYDVYCWGYNSNGQLGDGTTAQFRLLPTRVVSPTDAYQALAGGQYFTCARGSGTNLSCWGANAYGQLGNGTTVQAYSPVRPPACSVDADGDGYIDENNPAGCQSVGPDMDCNDANASVFPGATEICDGIANSCYNPIDGETFSGDLCPQMGTRRNLVVMVESWIAEVSPGTDPTQARIDLEQNLADAAQMFAEMSYGSFVLDSDVCQVSGAGIPIPQTNETFFGTAIALCDPQVNFADYDYIAVLPNQGNMAWGGIPVWAETADGSKWLRGVQLGIPSAGAGAARVLVHEIGHSLGLVHASSYECGYNAYGPECRGIEYGHRLDVMGEGGAAPDRRDFSCDTKDRLGWTDVVPAGVGSHAIANLEDPAPAGVPHCLSLPVDPALLQHNTAYGLEPPCDRLVLEYRTPQDMGWQLGVRGGIAVACAIDGGYRFVDWDIYPYYYERRRTVLLDCTPHSQADDRYDWKDYHDGTIASGQTCHTNLGYDIGFTATDAHLGTVTITAATPSYACVDYDNDGFQRVGAPPGCTMIGGPDANDDDYSVH